MIEQKFFLPLVSEFFSFMLSNSQGFRYGVGAHVLDRMWGQTVNWQLYTTMRNCLGAVPFPSQNIPVSQIAVS